MGSRKLDSSRSGLGGVQGFCEEGNEIFGFHRMREISLLALKTLQLLKHDFLSCSYIVSSYTQKHVEIRW
jgi:hypothetical protein